MPVSDSAVTEQELFRLLRVVRHLTNARLLSKRRARLLELRATTWTEPRRADILEELFKEFGQPARDALKAR